MNLAEGAVSYLKLTIPDGTKITEALELEDGVYPVGIKHGVLTTSVEINFNIALEKGGTLFPMYDGAGAAYAVTIDPAVAAYLPLVPADFVGIKHIQLAVADNQAGGDDIYLAVRGV
jgi:hypothetical protein